MNPIGLEAQKLGEEAEVRVGRIAVGMGYHIEFSSRLDYANKTDLLIEGIPVQISCKPKSKRQVESLASRGIVSIVAGRQLTDQEVAEQISIIVNIEA